MFVASAFLTHAQPFSGSQSKKGHLAATLFCFLVEAAGVYKIL